MCVLQAWKFKWQDWPTHKCLAWQIGKQLGTILRTLLGTLSWNKNLKSENFKVSPLDPPHLENKKRMGSAEDIDWGKHCLMVHSHLMLSQC